MSEQKLTHFTVSGTSVPVQFVETQTVKEGVECDIYTFTNDSSKDLAIVRVAKGYKTPLQRVLLGDKTVEGFSDGSGRLTVQAADGTKNTRSFQLDDTSSNREMIVEVGQIMQWHADGDNDLVFYEICEPPYTDGRFEDLPETT